MNHTSRFINANDGYAGVKFIIHSPTLESILKDFKINMPMETNEGNIVGDENWYFVCDEQKFEAPKNLEEVKEWILAFFECYGHYPLERPIYEDEDYQVDMETSKKLVKVIEQNIDKIITETEEFKIVCLYSDSFDNYEGSRVHYLLGHLHIQDIEIEDIVEFLEYFGMDGAEDLMDAGW